MRKDTKYISISEFEDKLPPVDVELEKIVLGSFMLEASTMLEASNFLEPDVFSTPEHLEIYKAIFYLFNEKQPYDIICVTTQLRKTKMLEFVGGPYYVATLTNRIGSTGNITYHCAILRQKWIQRKVIESGYNLLKIGYDEAKDCFEGVDEAELQIKAIHVATQTAQSNLITFKDLIQLEAQTYDAIKSGKNLGVMVGIDNINRFTNGWQAGDLIIVAARPGMGKSVLALNMGKNAAKENKKVAFFSLEMSSIQLMQRLTADESDINFDLIKKAKTNDAERATVNNALGRIENLALFIDDKAQTNVLGIWSKAAKIKTAHGLDMIVIDYIQLIEAPELGKYADTNTRVSHISRNLKLMAKDLGVPVIALSQLSREVEKRGGDKKPQLSDLRDSGSIEQDADAVCFVYRPAYYDIYTNKEGNAIDSDYAELIFAKHRNGELGPVRLRFDGAKQRFTSYTDNLKPLTPNVDFYESKRDDIAPF